MDKICPVCGNSFQAVNAKFKYCSDDCRKKYNRERLHIYRNTLKGKYYRHKYHEQHYEPANKHCTKCGELLTDGRASYCLDCLLKDYLYNNTAVTRQRLYNRGYDTESIMNEIKERGIT